MRIITPYILSFMVAFALACGAAIFTFRSGLQHQNRSRLIGGFLLAALAGGLLDFVIQITRISWLLGRGPGT